MAGLRFVDIQDHPVTVLDLTSLTRDEFLLLVPPFEMAFQEHMRNWRLDGLPRTARRFTVYATSPLPTPEDRLLFVLTYLKTCPLQVVQGRLFGMGQSKANQWLHALLPALQRAFQTLGDAPSRTLTDLAQRLGTSVADAHTILVGESHARANRSDDEQPASTSDGAASGPLFAMTVPSDASHAPKLRMRRPIVTAARKRGL